MKMDGENEEQEKEQQKQTEMLNSTDGSSNMPMDPNGHDYALPDYEDEIEKSDKMRKKQEEEKKQLIVKKQTKEKVQLKSKLVEEHTKLKSMIDHIIPTMNENITHAVDGMTHDVVNILRQSFDCDLVSISNTIADMSNTIAQDVITKLRDDFSSLSSAMTVLSNKLDTLIASSSSNPSPIKSNTPLPPSTPNTVSRYHNNVNASRTFPNRTHHSIINRNRSRSRSPIRPHTFKPSHQIKHYSPNRASTSKLAPIQAKAHIPPCTFCKSIRHFTKNCDVVMSVATRLAIVVHAGCCHKCFRNPNQNHHSSCQPPLCGLCVNQFGVAERHCEWLCPQNPSLTP